MFHVPNAYRLRDHEVCGTKPGDNFGAFTIPAGAVQLSVIADDGAMLPSHAQWEHVSVHVQGEARTPTWEEMSLVKSLFWDAEDAVIQIHPPKSTYVNIHPSTLHLWRSVSARQPLPPTILV